jgi:hypothetical protein
MAVKRVTLQDKRKVILCYISVTEYFVVLLNPKYSVMVHDVTDAPNRFNKEISAIFLL